MPSESPSSSPWRRTIVGVADNLAEQRVFIGQLVRPVEGDEELGRVCILLGRVCHANTHAAPVLSVHATAERRKKTLAVRKRDESRHEGNDEADVKLCIRRT